MTALPLWRKIEIEDRRDRVMHLARVGMTTRRIGAELKIGASTVSRDVKARLKEHSKQCEDTEQMRLAEIERLDALLTVWWVKAGEDLHALDRVLKIQEQRVRLLGIEPPKHVRHSGSGSTGNVTMEVTLLGSDSDEPIPDDKPPRRREVGLQDLAVRVPLRGARGSDRRARRVD